VVILGVDASRLTGPRTGVGRYLEYLFREWSRIELPFERVRLFSPAPIDKLPDDPRFELAVLPSGRPGLWWNAAKLRRRAADVDVMFAPYVLPPLLRGRAVVANLGVLEGPHADRSLRARGRSQHYAWSARRADVVLVHSANTKADVVGYYGVPEEKVFVVHLGVDEVFRPAQEGEDELIGALVERLLGRQVPYFLFVGKLSSRRNVPALLEGFAQIAEMRPDLHLLLVGPNTGTPELHTIVTRLGLDGRVRHLDHLEHSALALLYRGARAFVLPSTQEGFSATIVEALASGCAVLTVKHDALEEGSIEEAVLAVDEATASSLAAALARLDDDDELRERLRELGPRYVRRFSWQQTAQLTMDVLERTAAKR